MAKGFLRLGADVVICGRRKTLCDDVAAEWGVRFPERRVATYGVDIRDAGAVDTMADAIWQTGTLTRLVNNAAGNFVAQTHELSSRAFDAVANIVFTAASTSPTQSADAGSPMQESAVGNQAGRIEVS